jgi:hypothetical protein
MICCKNTPKGPVCVLCEFLRMVQNKMEQKQSLLHVLWQEERHETKLESALWVRMTDIKRCQILLIHFTRYCSRKLISASLILEPSTSFRSAHVICGPSSIDPFLFLFLFFPGGIVHPKGGRGVFEMYPFERKHVYTYVVCCQ